MQMNSPSACCDRVKYAASTAEKAQAANARCAQAEGNSSLSLFIHYPHTVGLASVRQCVPHVDCLCFAVVVILCNVI